MRTEFNSITFAGAVNGIDQNITDPTSVDTRFACLIIKKLIELQHALLSLAGIDRRVYILHQDNYIHSFLAIHIHPSKFKKKKNENDTKESGIIREHSSNSKLTFYSCTVFRHPRPLPEGALSCRWPAANCIVFYRMGRITAYVSIVRDFYFLVAM